MEAFTILFLFIFLSSILKTCIALDTIIPTHSIKDGDTVISAGGIFEVGFFSPGTSNNRYLGIGYKKISSKSVVWVANRETPLGDHSGVLSISNQGILVLSNGTGSIFWSSNSNTSSTTLENPVSRLLDSGNLVVQDNNSENFLWQSFDYPCDTLLPDMKLRSNFETGLNRYLSSSKSTEDPARGDFSLRIDPHGFPQLLLTRGQITKYRAGSWDGIDFTGLAWLHPEQFIKLEFIINENEIYYKYELLNTSAILRIKLMPTGNLQVDGWKDGINDWEPLLTLPVDRCDQYALCGENTSCNMTKSPICACLEGFVPKGSPKSSKDWNLSDWSEGCIRRTPLGCDNINGTTADGFFKYTGVKLPDTSSSWFNKTVSLKECESLCLKNCSCVAYANSDIRGGGSGCVLWFGNLIDIRVFPDGWQELYIRVSASELDHIVKNSSKKKQAKIIGASCSIILVLGMLLVGLVLYTRKKKLIKQGLIEKGHGTDSLNEDGKEDLELPIFGFITIANATDNFSSNKKLGEGGFGLVYKGTIDGQEIAVKRLSKNSGQGQMEFKNEVILIAKLQHRNLVKLLGCCIQGDERMLIYEFMPNKSLDFFIFDQTKRKLLDWRMRINIIDGIARGLLYLHHDSRLRIIHRDLKASNVLLDNNMNPKISDFGLARTFGLDQTSANTNRVVGTYGYMSPEYAVDGLFSVKSDVFSFGVLVLEILSGEKNRGFSHPDHQLNLVGHAWRLWIDGKALELLDKSLGNSCTLSELLRCIHVGLLCVQRRSEDRPNMSSVVLMLGSEGLLPQPKQPGFYTERNPTEANSSSSKHESCSVNEITFTSFGPR